MGAPVTPKMIIEEILPGAPADPFSVEVGATSPGVRFAWDTTNRAMPVDGWPGGVHVRKRREEDPGSDDVVEQIFGPSWKPFTLRGTWDDRHGGVGFAQGQLDAFTQLVQRCNLVRFTMGVETIAGVIEDFDFTRLRVRTTGEWWRITYSFVVSSHFKVEGGDARRTRTPAPQKSRSAADYDRAIEATARKLAAAQSRAPRSVLKALSFAKCDAALGYIDTAVDKIGGVIEANVVIGGTTSTRSASSSAASSDATGASQAGSRRAVQAFTEAATAAAALRDQARTLQPAAVLAYETAPAVMDFIAWVGGLQAAAIDLYVLARAAADDLARRIAPDAIAVYAPSAGELLANISQRYYHTPHRWRDIMRRNGLRSPVLGDDAPYLVIPR